MTEPATGTVAIIGIGLIGGSLAAAWRAAGFAERIVAIDPNVEAGEYASANGLVDAVLNEVPQDATLVAICTPSDRVVERVRALAGTPATVFDVGSVKGAILDELGDGAPANFVPCHPIAGSEQSGPQAASADLFRDAAVVLTPGADVGQDHITKVEGAWSSVGARCVRLAAEEHDTLLALTSHLPHLLAFAFMAQVDEDALDFTGGGFRDFTRIAGANPELWWRILSMNRDAVAASAATFRDDLDRLLAAIDGGDKEAGLAMLTDAARLRGQLE